MAQMLDDPTRVADRLAVDDEHRHPPLAGQRLDLVSARAAQRDAHLFEGDALAAERAGYPPAGAEPVSRGCAAEKGRHGGNDTKARACVCFGTKVRACVRFDRRSSIKAPPTPRNRRARGRIVPSSSESSSRGKRCWPCC